MSATPQFRQDVNDRPNKMATGRHRFPKSQAQKEHPRHFSRIEIMFDFKRKLFDSDLSEEKLPGKLLKRSPQTILSQGTEKAVFFKRFKKGWNSNITASQSREASLQTPPPPDDVALFFSQKDRGREAFSERQENKDFEKSHPLWTKTLLGLIHVVSCGFLWNIGLRKILWLFKRDRFPTSVSAGKKEKGALKGGQMG